MLGVLNNFREASGLSGYALLSQANPYLIQEASEDVSLPGELISSPGGQKHFIHL